METSSGNANNTRTCSSLAPLADTHPQQRRLTRSVSQPRPVTDPSKEERLGHDFGRVLVHADARASANGHPATLLGAPPPGPALVEHLGGRLHISPAVDAALEGLGARAATLGGDVFVRSDIAMASTAHHARKTFAHEALHLLQQRGASGTPILDPVTSGPAEQEARAGVNELLGDRIPQIRHRQARPTLSLQLDSVADFEPGVVNLSNAQADPLWVDRDIINYELSETEPWTFTVLYADGSVLTIPLTVMSFQPLTGASLTLLRRHRRTGRIVPFQVSQDDPRLREPARDPNLRSRSSQEILTRAVPPRFDPRLTPTIMNALNEAQITFAATGILNVASLRLLSPLGLGWGPRAAASSPARVALRRLSLQRGAVAVGTNAAAVGERLFAEVSRLGGTGLQRFLEFARRLSMVPGLTPQAKAALLERFAARFGLDVGGQIAKEGGRILLLAKDGKTAFQIAADGSITFGRFNLQTLDIMNPTAIRPLGGP